MVFNTAADVRRVLHLDSSNEVLTDAEIDTYLTEANEDLFAEIKKKYEMDQYDVRNDKDGRLIDRYFLTLAPVTSILKVLVNNELLADTNYTLDNDTAEIVFSGGISEGDVLRIFYEPQIYELAELYLCAYNINLATNILNRGGTQSPIADSIERKKDNFMSVITSRLIVSSWT